MPLISMIVPVYNVAPYLDRCITSLLHQTFKDFELILVDDGSTDDSGTICDAWASADKRIRVLHKINGGISDARNKGIEIAGGEYFAFPDGDDYVEKDYLEKLIELITKYDADMAIVNYRDIYNDIPAPKKRTDMTEGVWEFYEFWNNYYEGFKVYCDLAWNKLYKRKLFNDLKYEFGRVSQDNLLTFELAKRWKRVAVTGEIKVYYCHRSDSTTGKPYTLARLAAPEAEIRRTEGFIYGRSWDLAVKSVLRAKHELIKIYMGLQKADRESDEFNHLKSRYKDTYKVLKSHLSMRERLAASVFLFNPKITRALILLRKKPTGGQVVKREM